MEKQPIKKQYSEALGLLRFPLAVVVVAVHVFSAVVPGADGVKESSTFFQETSNLIFSFLRGQSVPIYFFISGYVFFLGITLDRETYKRKLYNRSKTLLIPFIIWNLLLLLQYVILRMPAFASFAPSISQIQPSWGLRSVLQCFWDATQCVFPDSTPGDAGYLYPINGPLWFLRDLMIVVLTTPILYWLLKRVGVWFVLLLGIAKVMAFFLDWGYSNQLLIAFFFFSWGAYMSVKRKDMMAEFGKYKKTSAVLYLALATANMLALHYWPEACQTLKLACVFVGLLFAYNLAAWLVQHGWCHQNEFLASASFFIYVSHRLVWIMLLKLVSFVIPPTSGVAIVAIMTMTLVLTVALLLAVFWLMRRYTPGLLKVVAGRK